MEAGQKAYQTELQGLNVQAQMQAAQAQAIAAQHAAQISQLGRPRPPYQWMVDGDPLTFEQFVERVFPEDTPERTFFLLKYKK